MSPAFFIRTADWRADRSALRHIRETVFVHEQQVPLELEWDEDDAAAAHLLALDQTGNPIGTGRITPDGRIGRMAVLSTWRGCGVGSALLRGLMDIARRHGSRDVVLNAQVSAIPFYLRHGYELEGERFMEAGIEHQRMRLQLPTDV